MACGLDAAAAAVWGRGHDDDMTMGGCSQLVGVDVLGVGKSQRHHAPAGLSGGVVADAGTWQ